MRVQKKTKETEKPQKPPKDTMPLCDVKKVLYGLTSSVYTYRGAVVVPVPSGAYCFLRIDPYMSNHRSSRYNSSEVYALRDCLIHLFGASQVNTGYGSDSYFLEHYVIPFERGERKDNRRKLSDQLKPFLDKINCCLLDELSKADSFGIRIAEKVVTQKEGDTCPTPTPSTPT